MGLLRKKKKTISLEKHNVRFNFEYGCLPSAATFAPIQWFSPDNEGGDLFILDDEMKGVSWVKEYIENTSMTIYNVAGGQISMLKLPTPEASPELAYAAVTVTDQLLTTMKDETDLYYRPFYILAKMVDCWCFGEVKYDKYRDDNSYYTEYYKMVDNADPVEFIEWVMQREGFMKLEDIEQNDPVANFLKSK